jgi:hypothetical protein
MNVEQMRKNVSMMILPLSFECSATIYKEKLSRLRNRCYMCEGRQKVSVDTC